MTVKAYTLYKKSLLFFFFNSLFGVDFYFYFLNNVSTGELLTPPPDLRTQPPPVRQLPCRAAALLARPQKLSD